MKKIIASMAVAMLVSSSAMAATGWLDSYARLFDGADDNYTLNNAFAGTPGPINAGPIVGAFNGTDLGTVSTLFLNAEISGWADAGDAFSDFRLHYRVNSGTWITDSVDSVNNIGGNNWRGEAQGNNLITNPDTVVGPNIVELYLSRTHTWGGGSYTTYMNVGSDPVDGIGGAVDPGSTAPTANFFTARFTVVPEPGTLALFGLGMAGLAIARRRKA